jgi:mercuric ion transport protein
MVAHNDDEEASCRENLSGAATLRTAQSREDKGVQVRKNLMAVGGLLAALAAASCCVVPFTLFLLGIGGAWIGNLTALAPYQSVFTAFAFGCVGRGFYLVYRKPAAACAEGSYCAEPGSKRLAKVGLWAATILVVIALGLPKLTLLFL